MAGTLYIVATPIGNLDDMPPRVAATFGAADFIAAEDTRVTMKLLNFLGLKKPMVSYYEHALQKGEGILRRIEEGENCALCSDAGMPCISDPGEQIVREAHVISPEELKIPDYIRKDTLDANGIEYKEVNVLEDVLPELDLLYMTRVQRERFFNEEDYIRLKDSFILDSKKMKLAPKDMLVLHPLPRVNEIATDVDDDPRAVYFKQAQYGVYIRMALIMTLLEVIPEC